MKGKHVKRLVWVPVMLCLVLLSAIAHTDPAAKEFEKTGSESILITAASTPSLIIHADRTREPISKYIYGQFIEHLGRCIYGGIWAEMLEDRKFYFPITPEYKPWSIDRDRGGWRGGEFPVLTGSPWEIFGGDDAVAMIKENAFVGEQTPEIQAAGSANPRGIEQGELGLVEGKAYTGYVLLAGDAGAAPIQVRLIWGEGNNNQDAFSIDKITGEYTKYAFQFKSKAATLHGRLQIVGKGKGKFRIGTVSLMPADNVHGFRADTLALLKELNSPVYRWPGGNFVSDYNWRDGIGDRDQRPPRKNPAWTGIEPNDVGLHEFLDFCDLIQTEPYVTVNTGKGTVEMAAEEVQYCNGSADTPMGKQRAQNGHPESFHVKYWAVGNEMYGDWQLGHMPLEEYVKKHNHCVDLMRAVDPSIQVVACGSVGKWSQTMMAECADYMELISEHFYRKDKENLVEHVEQIPTDVKRIADAHRQYRESIPSLKGKNIRIALDEWNYWYGPYLYGELGVRYHLQDALGIAAGLHEYIRNSDIYFMANYAQTVNVIGCIKTTKTDAAFATTGLALKLYRNHFGEIPVDVEGDLHPLDAVAALAADGKLLTLAVVNPTPDRVSLGFTLEGKKWSGTGKIQQIGGTDKMAYNEPGKEPAVRIVEETLSGPAKTLSLEPISVSLFTFNLQ